MNAPIRKIEEIYEIETVWNKKFVKKFLKFAEEEYKNLGEYEKICPICKGLSTLYIFSTCERCSNKGTITWIDEIKNLRK